MKNSKEPIRNLAKIFQRIEIFCQKFFEVVPVDLDEIDDEKIE